jgi:hypothetical protein
MLYMFITFLKKILDSQISIGDSVCVITSDNSETYWEENYASCIVPPGMLLSDVYFVKFIIIRNWR